MKQRGAKTAFKKALELGTIWTAFNHLDDKHLGIRKVVKVQGNGVAFETQAGTLSWLYFDDKDADYVSHGYGNFQVYDGDSLVLTYNRQA